jgi:ABC-type multidrug transport system fused ATPase/permease subunit
MSQGEIVAMITAEAEPLGGFVGDSVALPVFQGGTLITIVVFMFVQDWVLGLAAISLYPIQAYFIPKLQRRVNQLKKQRTVKIRRLSDRVGEVVNTAQEMHAHDASQSDMADYSQRMQEIYDIRYQIYRQKFLIKFINNFLAQLTPFFFYSIGGYLVIQGDLSFGALVAVLAAYKDLSAPWKELLNYYQNKEDARIKYELLIETFLPAGLMSASSQLDEPAKQPVLAGELLAKNVDLREEGEDDNNFGSGTSFRFEVGQKVAIVGDGASGRDRLAMILAGLQRPLGGSITVAGEDVTTLPETVTGRRIGYVGAETRLRSGTLADNLFYALKHRPIRDPDYDDEARRLREKHVAEAQLTGNSQFDINADWIDYQVAGISGPEALTQRAIEVLSMVEMEQDVYQLGLQVTIDPSGREELAKNILQARSEMRERLQEPDIAPLVELFDRSRYNNNMTVAENLLFGTPCDATFALDTLSENEYVQKVLNDTGLMSDFLVTGRKVAALMVDLFADVPPESELFEQFSFISADDLPTFRSMLSRTDGVQPQAYTDEDKHMVLSLPFKLIPARHRLGVVDKNMEHRLLQGRKAFAEGLAGGPKLVEFFDPGRYNPAISIQDNVLFGRLAYGKARSAVRVGGIISEVVEKLNLRQTILELGLEYPIGIAGSRLNTVQRQKLAIARCVLKRPDVLVVDNPTAVMDAAAQERIRSRLFEEFSGRGLIWVLNRARLGEQFDHILVMEGGKVVEQGQFAALHKPGTVLYELVEAS